MSESGWAANQNELGFFVDHFTFMAGLLYAAAHGPGRWLTCGELRPRQLEMGASW